MDLQRWTFRSLLLLLAAVLVAGCSTPGPQEGVGANDTSTVNPDETGCTGEGQTGTGTGDLGAYRQCPEADDGNITAPSMP